MNLNKNNNIKFKNGLIGVQDYNEMSNETMDRYLAAKGDEKARELIEEHLRHIEKCYESDKSAKKWRIASTFFILSLLILLGLFVTLILDSVVNQRMFNDKIVYSLLGFIVMEITAVGIYLGFSNRSKIKEG